MGYRRMDKHVLATIFRRWIDGRSISTINELEGFDRKTVRAYIRRFEAHGYRAGQKDLDQERLNSVLDELLPDNQRCRSKREQLEPYREEWIRLVNSEDSPADAVKPKTAYLILVEKYGRSATRRSRSTPGRSGLRCNSIGRRRWWNSLQDRKHRSTTEAWERSQTRAAIPTAASRRSPRSCPAADSRTSGSPTHRIANRSWKATPACSSSTAGSPSACSSTI